jgi:hypothetical protein
VHDSRRLRSRLLWDPEHLRLPGEPAVRRSRERRLKAAPAR